MKIFDYKYRRHARCDSWGHKRIKMYAIKFTEFIQPEQNTKHFMFVLFLFQIIVRFVCVLWKMVAA